MNFNQFISELGYSSEFIKKHSEREEILFGKVFDDITYLPYDVLKKEIPELFKQKMYEQAILLIVRYKGYMVSIRRVKKLDNYIKLKFIFHIDDQYQQINNLEQKYLTTRPDPKMINAGIRELDVLGDTNLIDTLADGDILKWEKIRKLPYSQIFDKQLRNTILYKVNKKLSEK